MTTLKDLQELASLVDADFFFKDGTLPDLAPGINLSSILASSQITSEVSPRKWKACKDKSSYAGHGDEVFALMQHIIADVRAAAQPTNVSTTLRYDCRPSTIPRLGHRDSRSRPDFYGILPGAQHTLPEWADIAAPGAFKRNDTRSDVNDVCEPLK